MNKSPLSSTLNILHNLIQHKTSLKQSFSAKTLPITKEICFGVCRNFFTLETIAQSLIKKKPKDVDIWLIILIGIYQIRYLKTPSYAAVKETVNLVKKPWAKSLVNAVLRNYCRNQSALDAESTQTLTANYNHPQWLIEKIKNCWPNHWQDILLANNQHPPLSLRVNNAKITTQQYLQLLEKANITAKTYPQLPTGVILDKPVKITELPGFIEGKVSVQDLGAQIAVLLLDLQPDQHVLDACAAPGGKTCHILESEPKLADCLAIDIEPKRLAKIEENLQRLGLKATVKAHDCLDTNNWWNGQQFDRILLDAPCSASGVIRRNPDIKLIRSPADVAAITEVQKDLLNKLWTTLKPGGKLVYVTCSILHDENQLQIANFLSAQTDSKCGDIHPSLQGLGIASEYGLQILPSQNNLDGFFYCVLEKLEIQ